MTTNSSSAPSIASRLPQIICHFVSHRRALVLPLVLAAIVWMALLSRIDFFVIEGGLKADQANWARGGITSGYLTMRDVILTWTAEDRLWPYPPGYPAFLAALHAIGVKDLTSVRLVQAVIDALAILPLYFVLRSIGCTTAATLFAALAYAIAPWWSAGSTYLLGESLLPMLMLLLLAGMVVVRDRASGLPTWFLFGVLSTALPFFRSDMILLIGPLVIWALLVSPGSRRISSSAALAVGYMLPLLLWSARNYHVHGIFTLTPPAKWYAAWSGLGQVANGFGYFVDDQRASDLLTSKGLPWNSIQSEAYWHAEYLKAWAEHPGHVIKAIVFRFGLILARLEPLSLTPAFALRAYTVMAFVTPVVLGWLLYRRRWADAFLTALPMAYALGSLGFLYVEFRYVRYAGITYLFASAVALTEVGSRLSAWKGSKVRAGFKDVRPVVYASLLLVVCLGALYQLHSTQKAAEAQGLSDRLDIASSSQLPVLRLDDLVFEPPLSTVRLDTSDEKLRLQGQVPTGSLLAVASLRAQAAGVVIIRYHSTVRRGAIGVGVLAKKRDRWLSFQSVPAGANGESDAILITRVEPGSWLAVNAVEADNGIEAVLSKLQWSLACPGRTGVFRLLYNTEPIPATACAVASLH